MYHFGHELEEEVVGYGEQDTVGRLVDIDSAEVAVVLGDEGCMWRHYLVLAVAYALIHERASLWRRETIECGFGNVLDDTLGNGVLPALG